MKLEEAIDRLDRATGNQQTLRGIRIRQRFSNILQEIKYKDLSSYQKEALEAELAAIFLNLDLESVQTDQYLNTSHQRFIKFLRREFYLLPEGYFARLGMRAGFATGILFMLYFIFFTTNSLQYFAPLGGFLTGATIGSLYDRYRKGKGRTFLAKTV